MMLEKIASESQSFLSSDVNQSYSKFVGYSGGDTPPSPPSPYSPPSPASPSNPAPWDGN